MPLSSRGFNSGKFGAKRGLYAAFTDTRASKSPIRNELGRFVSVSQDALRQSNEVLARDLQASVVSNIQSRIKRRRVSTNRLVRVTASPDNRFADPFGLGVGVEGFLNKSEAKYWRTIEEGSAVTWADTPGGRAGMIGLELHGHFGGTLGKWNNGPSGPWISATAPWNVPGGMFQPDHRMPYVTEVQHEIRPMYAYRDAYKEAGVAQRSQEIVDSYLRRILRLAVNGR